MTGPTADIPPPTERRLAGAIEAFYRAALDGDAEGALATLEACAGADWSAVLLGAVRKIDADWQEDRRPLAEVVEAYWVARRAIERMQSRRGTARREGGRWGRALLAVPEGEDHGFGAQIFADRLAEAGWQVDFRFGATPAALPGWLARTHYDMLGLSIGCDQGLLGLPDLVAEARMASANPALKVTVGGSLFREAEQGFDFIGADFVARDAEAGLTFAERARPALGTEREH